MSTTANQYDIDFLPARYREQNVRRRLNVWRLAVVVSFGLLVGFGALHQWAVRWSVERELRDVQARYAAQQEGIGKLNSLNAALSQTQAEAQLFAYLAHPWPRTQLLAAVLQPLPAGIHVSELRLVRERIESNKPAPSALPSPAPGAVAPPAEPAPTMDLAALREECDATEIAVLIEGTVDSAELLQQYLAAVTKAPLVKSAELQSLSADSDDGTLFKVRIEIVPGIGQPGGPGAERQALAAREGRQ